ncbi:MAG TPA: EAL domain-containing protein [Frankiaceae bacterium]|nr:EAL domain-containing protein [Frankiaceae bacterium]
MLPSVLLVEDSPGDASLVRVALRAAAPAELPYVRWVTCLADAVAAVREREFGCVLLDLGLPDAHALDALDALLVAAPGVAIVVLSAQADRGLAQEAVHHGAQDYLLKSELTAEGLERAIRYAVERAAAQAAIARREAEQRALVESLGEGVVVHNAAGEVADVNPAAERILGLTADQFRGRTPVDPRWGATREDGRPFDGEDHPAMVALRTGEPVHGVVMGVDHPERGRRWIEINASPLRLPGSEMPYAAVASFRDITERRAAEDAASRLSAIVDSSDDAIIGRLLDGTIVSFNPAAERLTGYPAAEAIGRHPTFTAPPDRVAQINDVLARVARGESVPPYETVVVRKDGTTVECSLTVSPIRDARGTVIGSSAIAKDITEQIRLRRAAEDDRRRLAEAQAVAGLGSFEHVLDGDRITWSDELYRIFGMPVGAPLTSAAVFGMVHEDDRSAFEAKVAEAKAHDEPVEVTYRVVRPDGDVRTVTARFRAPRDGDGTARRIVGTALDVTERARAERRFELGFEGATAGTAIADLDGRFVRVNAALCALLGRSEEELAGHHPDEFLPVPAPGQGPFAAALAGPHRTGVEIRFTRPSGEAVDALVDVAVVCRESGEPDYVFAQLLDITRRKRAERALAHQALHDGLTGLPNRILLLDRLDHALLQHDRRLGGVAVLMVDLDHFKLVNDGLGHSAGDALLVDVASRLSAAVRPGDTVSRLGGDEFVVCCEDVSGPDDAREVAERVLGAFATPFVVEGRELFVTASVGVTVSSPGARADSLLRDADAAMYRAKERGRARTELFDTALRQRAATRLGVATALRRGLLHDEFVVHYQPIVSLADERLVGFEALVRWNDPQRGLVPPAEFVPVAEETGLIVPLGTEVLRQATEQLARWTEAYASAADVTMAVNVSARQLLDPGFVPTVAELLAASGIAPARLHLEITETVLMEDLDDAVEVLRALAGLGVTLEIDDFGTGYSSLSYLKRLPVDTLKVDRGFVSGLGTDADDLSIVTAITALGQALGLRLHAEGVETAEQRAAVRELGCDVAQGFLWSPPLPALAAERWLRRRTLGAVPPQRAPRGLAVSG